MAKEVAQKLLLIKNDTINNVQNFKTSVGNTNCDFKKIFTPIVIRAKPSRLRPFYPQDQAGVAIKEANLVAISPRLSLLSTVEGNLYIPSTINTDYLLWHTQLIVSPLVYFGLVLGVKWLQCTRLCTYRNWSQNLFITIRHKKG